MEKKHFLPRARIREREKRKRRLIFTRTKLAQSYFFASVMASSTVSNKCVANKECKKNGIIKCDGCSSRFCSDHFPIHRQELETRLELLCSERDQFHQETTYRSRDPTEVLTQIDRWEEQTLVQVKKTASNARDRIRQLSAAKSSNRELEQFSEELRRRKESEDYFEDDIRRLKQQLEQIKIQSKKLSKIDISYKTIDWETIIQVTNKEEKQLSRHLFNDTSLLNLEQQQILNGFCGTPHQQWQLIYRGTRNGFEKGKFLRHCADRGPTMTLILANGYLFGGYTTASWKNTGEGLWITDESAFLFTLTNPHRIPPTKYPVKSSGDCATWSAIGLGPTFGHFDICIHPNSNQNAGSNIGFPKNYRDTTGIGENTFTGTTTFQTSEIEVYKQV